MTELRTVAIYADESCLGNGRDGDNPGGAGGVVEFRDNDSGMVTRFDYWSSERATTNNRMALRSVIDAFRGLSEYEERFHVVFTSDSRYIVEGMKSWVPAWIRRGWRRKAGAVENLALWQEAVQLAGLHECEWHWVRGHAGHPQNEYANHLATRAAAKQTRSGGFRPSGFNEWVSTGKMRLGETAAFPVSVPGAAMSEGVRRNG